MDIFIVQTETSIYQTKEKGVNIVTNNTGPDDRIDESTDTSGNDKASEAMAFSADTDNVIEMGALDASAAFRNSGDKRYLYDGRGRRPSTIL